MSILDFLFRRGREEKKSAEGLQLYPIYGSGGLFQGQGTSQGQLMDQAKGWAYACIAKIAEEIGASGFKLYQAKSKDKGEWEEIFDHPLLDLLNAPNASMPRSELMQITSMHDDLAGNAYWLLDGVTTETDEPTAIYPVNPRYVTPIIGVLPDFVKGYRYDNGKQQRVLQPFEVIHFRRPNPNNPYVGLSPTEASADSIDADNWAREWNRKFFQNSARPGFILETDQVDERTVRMIRESFDDKYSGTGKAHKTAVLPMGVKIAHAGFAQKDMDFVELRRFSRDEILAQYGVPAVVLGLGLGETINRASAETLEYVYAKRTIRPKLRRFETFINEFLVSRFGEGLYFEFDDPVPQNIELDLRMAESSLARSPWASINEVRRASGLPPIDGGDMVMGSAMLTPVGAPEEATKAKTKQIIHKDRTNQTQKNAKKRAEIASELSARIKASMVKSIKAIQKADWSPMWDAFVKRTEPAIPEIRKAMQRYAVGMGERAKENLADATKALDMGKLLDRDTEVAAIIKLVGPIYQKILKEEGQRAADMVGEAFDETDKRVQDALAKSTLLMADKYDQETRALLEDKLRSGLADGLGLDKLSELVQEVSDFSSEVRADRVAKTEAFRVANLATKEAWKQTSVVKSVKWYTAKDEMVCEYCGIMDGEEIPIDDTFFDRGDTMTGADGGELDLSYANVESPPLHPNCRCYIRPEEIVIPD